MNVTAERAVSLEQARYYIDSIDLNYIVIAMCSNAYPLPCWTTEDAQHCCQLYKNFLYLLKKHSSENLVPTREIDEFWHNHILYTKNYTKDCLHIFGHYLHHEPTTPDDDLELLSSNYLKTKEFYFQEFNEPLKLTRS